MTPDSKQKQQNPVMTDEYATNFGAAESASQYTDTSLDASRPPRGSGNAQDWVGKSLGKYQITAVLGQGAMGVVLKARDPMIEREVAIKVLADHLAADANALGRFLAEAR